MLENIEVIWDGEKERLATLFRRNLISELKFVLFSDKLIVFSAGDLHYKIFSSHKNPSDAENKNFLGAGKISKPGGNLRVYWDSGLRASIGRDRPIENADEILEELRQKVSEVFQETQENSEQTQTA